VPRHLKVLVRKDDFEALSITKTSIGLRLTPAWRMHADWRDGDGVGFGLATQISATAFTNLRITRAAN
jgi:hypothetical protein